MTGHRLSSLVEGADGGWTAHCSCGWSSKREEKCPHMNLALSLHMDHVEAADDSLTEEMSR